MSNLCFFLILCLLVSICLNDSGKYANAEPEVTVTNEEESNRVEYIRRDVLEEMFNGWRLHSQQRKTLVEKLAKAGKVISPHQKRTDSSITRDLNADPYIQSLESAQLPFEDVTNQLYRRYYLSRAALTNQLPRIRLNGELSRQSTQNCTESITPAVCDPSSRYRRIDGQCNNLQNPRWGSAMTCQPRLLQPNYSGTSGFRLSVNGQPLPRPRQLSLNVHNHVNRPTNYVNHLYMFFGQLLDHDITQTPQSTSIDNQAINCCPPENETHPQCAPILVSRDDPFYSQFNTTCINFVRSAICPTCTLGPRQLMNQVTSTIDASFVYGNSENTTRSLRTNDGTGRLRVQRSDFGDLLPPSPDPQNDQCSFPETNEICFEAGDSRANQHTVLTSLHTIFIREHNRIAAIFRQINPRWNGERIFQETRRILGAQMQAITYKEYLPITLNNDRMDYFRLRIGSWTRHNPSENPTSLLEFTTAAFRFGHSLINRIIANRPLNASNEPIFLRNDFFQPFGLYTGITGPIVEGASNSPAQWFDRHLVPDVTNFLYRVRGTPAGLDLAAININRGRDHGMPTYVETVRYCSMGQINVGNFDDLERRNLMTSQQRIVLENNYRYVQDIDLWTGILSEIYMEGSVVGPTGACIIGIQFNRMKYGDRFYFEHINEAGSFTYQQLEELRRTTLSQIICLNANVGRMPNNAMLFANGNNPYIDCRSVRGINLSYWRE